MCNITQKHELTTKNVHYKECSTFLPMCVKKQNQHLLFAVAKSEQCVIYLKSVCVCVCFMSESYKFDYVNNSASSVKLHSIESSHVVNISASKDSIIYDVTSEILDIIHHLRLDNPQHSGGWVCLQLQPKSGGKDLLCWAC